MDDLREEVREGWEGEVVELRGGLLGGGRTRSFGVV